MPRESFRKDELGLKQQTHAESILFVTRQKVRNRLFTGRYEDTEIPGTLQSAVCCGQPLVSL